MLGRISTVVLTAGAMLAIGASAVSAAPSHRFTIGDVRGVSAWGTYTSTGKKVTLDVCVKDTDKKYPTAAVLISFYDRHGNGDHYTFLNSKGGGRAACHKYASQRIGAIVLVAEKGTGTSLATWRAKKWGTLHTLYVKRW